MTKNPLNSFFIILALLTSQSVQFHFKNPVHLSQENFVLRYLLTDKPYEGYHDILKNTFETKFHMHMAVQEDVPRMWEFLMTTNESSLQTRFNQDTIGVEQLKDSLGLIVLNESNELKRVFNKNKPLDATTELSDLTYTLNGYFKDYLIYFVKSGMENQRLTNLSNSINRMSHTNFSAEEHILSVVFPDEVIEHVVNEVVGISKQFERTFDPIPFKEYLNNLIHTHISSKLQSFVQFFQFRNGGSALLADFATRVMSGIKDDSIVLDSSSEKKFLDLMIATIYINKKYLLDDSHQHMANFAVQSVFPNRLKLGELRFFNLVNNIFKIFAIDITTDTYRAGRQVMVNYLFPDEDFEFGKQRRHLLERIYEKNGISFDHSQNEYQLIDKANMLYIIDLIWVTTEPSFQIADKDFKLIMNNFQAFYQFDSSKTRILDHCDKFFAVADNEIDTYIEIYHALYNSALVSVTEWTQQIKYDENSFIDIFEAFLAFAKSNKFDVDEFNFHIDNYYIIFKLINLSKNKNYFIDHDNIFLRFDTVNDPNINGFINSIADIVEFLSKWKDSIDLANKTKFFNVNMLNEMTITKEFTKDFFDETASNNMLFI